MWWNKSPSSTFLDTRFWKLLKESIDFTGIDAEKNLVHVNNSVNNTTRQVHRIIEEHNHVHSVNNTTKEVHRTTKEPNHATTVSTDINLMWIAETLSGQTLSTMIDTGATPNCIALRFVVASSYLKGLTRKQCHGKTVIDANGNHLKPKFVISVSVVLGSTVLSFECDFIVIDGLPFSFILGQSLLSKFDTWYVCNVSKNIIFNNQTRIPFYSYPPDDCIQLLITNKSIIDRFQLTVVNTRVQGSALSAFRPVTKIYALSEGNNELSNILQINILPLDFVASYQNCSTQFTTTENYS